MRTLVAFDENELPAVLKTHAKSIGQNHFSVELDAVQQNCPELLDGFKLLSKQEAKNPEIYRRAVQDVGLERVIIVW